MGLHSLIMFTNKKNFFIALSIFTFIFVGFISFTTPVNGQGTNLITSFNQGSSYPYDAPSGVKTLTTNGNNINPAIETRGNVGGAVSNELKSIDTSKKYTLTYTFTLNSGTAPDIRLVSGPQGRSNYTSPQNSGLNIVAQTGTRSYIFTPTFAKGYLEVSVTNGAKTNFKMENISVVVTPLPTVTISASPTSVAYNSASNITWTSTNASSCAITKASTPNWQTGISGTNVSSGALTANTTFTATCTGAGGTATASATVNVTAPPVSVSHSTTFNLTVTESIPSTPTNLNVSASDCNNAWLNLSWTESANATSYKVYRDGGATPVTLATYSCSSGTCSGSDTGLVLGSTHSYTVKASNSAGDSVATSPAKSGTVASACPVIPLQQPDLTIIGGVTSTPTSILPSPATTVFHSTIKNQGAVSTQTISYVFTPTFANGYLEVSVINGAKTNFSMTDVRVVSNSNSTNLITSFKQGSPYSYNTLTTSANNITSAIESSGNIGGAVSNPISLIPGQPYTLTYTYTPNPTNPGTAPDIRLVKGPEGRGNYTSPQNSGLNIVAQTGTFPYFFQKTTSVDANGQSTGTVTDLTSPVSKTTTAALGANANYIADSPSVSLVPNTYYLRACADKSSAAGGGVINESDEGNNCGGSWTTVTVACVSGTTWNTSSKTCVTNPPPVATLNVNSKVDSQSVTGVSITGTSGFGGTTNYIKTSNSTISTVLTALAISGKNFDNWSGDCSGPNPCNVTVNPGWTKTVTANYTTPVISPTAAIEMWLNNDPTKARVRVYLGRTATVNLKKNDGTNYTACQARLDAGTLNDTLLDIDATDINGTEKKDFEFLLPKNPLTVGTHRFTISCSKGGASVYGVAANGSTELQIQVIDLNFEEN
ncbi:MAG: NOTCH2 protein [Parcubacteria group bacterium GW2011_GWB1_36_5]|nr:MAG: NOTCH2 protein [Parcubacteria group bacterium GW2011_GWB1_36_5]